MNHTFEDSWLSKALIYYKIIDESLFEELSVRNSDDKYFYDILTKNNLLAEKEIIEFVKSALQISTVNLDKVIIKPDVIQLIPEDICRKYNLIGLKMNKTYIAVAFSNPFNLDAENEIEYLAGKHIKKFFAPIDKIKKKINEHYSPEKIITSLVESKGKKIDIKFSVDTNFDSDSPIVRLVDQIIFDSIAKGASDIHIEPKESGVQVRFRIDGVLKNELEVPSSVHAALSSRIKIISNLNIAEHRKPQDGKAKVTIEEKDIDLRVSVLPTSFGEKIVIRILDKRNATISFDKMGIVGHNRKQLESCFHIKQGMVLVTGPTGSGKSTTLYAALNRIRSTTNNILTIEDPIEYMFDGINQVQVNEKAGVTFASALRSFLRQDPDVILVGEIRDKETAEISIQASLTGHLVLSTLHTNDTFTTLTRLTDMGVDKFKITEALEAIVAQRLVRKLCNHCKTEVDPKNVDEKLLNTLKQYNAKVSVYKSNGCAKCEYMGYKGRIGVYEILVLDNFIKDMINNNTSMQILRKTVKSRGFKNLFENALELVAQGITDYNEIIRVINPVLDAFQENSENGKETHKQPAKNEKKVEKLKKSQPKLAQPQDTIRPKINKRETYQEHAKIMIIDDSEHTRVMVGTIIKKLSQWQTIEASDGEQALDMLKTEKPDLIILDIMMPNMDGYEFLQEMKNNPNLKNIPVLVFSALKTDKSEQRIYELGADGFIVKPIEPDKLIEQLKKVLNRTVSVNNAVEEIHSNQEELELRLV